MRKWLNAIAGYGKAKYEGKNFDTDGILKRRDEDWYYGTLGVDYAMQSWLMWNLAYTCQERDSNFIRYDYEENRVFLSAMVYF